MKKCILLILCFILFVSCVKQVPEELAPIDFEGRTTVDAVIESLLLGKDTRLWPEDAAIGLCGSVSGTNEKYLLRKADASLREAVFYGPKVVGNVASYYPWNPSYTGSWGRMTVTLDNNQKYVQTSGALEQFISYCPMAFGFESGGKVEFQYPFGVLAVKVALEEDLQLDGIILSSESIPFAGTGIVTKEGITFPESASRSINLSFDAPASIHDGSGNPVPFYFILPPFEFHDLKIDFRFSGEEPFVCDVGDIQVPRIDASSFSLLSIVVGTNGPEGFTPVNVQFDEE